MREFSPGMPVLATGVVPAGDARIIVEGLSPAGGPGYLDGSGFGHYWLAGQVNGEWRTISIHMP